MTTAYNTSCIGVYKFTVQLFSDKCILWFDNIAKNTKKFLIWGIFALKFPIPGVLGQCSKMVKKALQESCCFRQDFFRFSLVIINWDPPTFFGRPCGFWQDHFFKFSFWLPWHPEFCMELRSSNNFERGLSKDHSCEASQTNSFRLLTTQSNFGKCSVGKIPWYHYYRSLQITWIWVSMFQKSLPKQLRHLVSFAGI